LSVSLLSAESVEERQLLFFLQRSQRLFLSVGKACAFLGALLPMLPILAVSRYCATAQQLLLLNNYRRPATASIPHTAWSAAIRRARGLAATPSRNNLYNLSAATL